MSDSVLRDKSKELLKDIGDISEEMFNTMQNDIISLRRMLVSSVTTLKSKLKL